MTTCAHHPEVAARWRCGFCARALCDRCVNERQVKEKSVTVCRECGGRCEPLAGAPVAATGATAPAATAPAPAAAPASARAAAPAAAPAVEPAGTAPSGRLLDDLRGALLFPLRLGDSRLDLVLTACFLLGGGFAIGLADRLGHGVAGMLLFVAVALVVAAAFAGYLMHILETTAAGSDAPPGWPDMTRSFWEPIQYSLPTVLLCHGPALIWAVVAGGGVVYWLLWAAASAVVPMCLLANVLTRSWWGLHPGRLIRSIARAPGDYAVVTLGWNVLGWLDASIGQLVQAYLPFGSLLRLLLLVYTLSVQMRLLGLFYRRNEERLAWF